MDCKVLFTDLDGTLIKTSSGLVFPKGIWDMEFRFDVLDKIKELQPQYVVIVTNQGGIEKKFVREIDFGSKLDYVEHAVREYTGVTTMGKYCISNDPADRRRKPNVGMLEDVLSYHIGERFSKDDMLMIGDASGKPGQFSDTDKRTAENFGIKYLDVDDFVKM